MRHRLVKDVVPTLLVLREHDSVWAPHALGTVLSDMQVLHSGLEQAGYRVIPLQLKSSGDLTAVLAPFDPRTCVVFNCYEGVEEGASDAIQVAEGLDALGYTYTGADSLALAITQDKARAQQLLEHRGIPTPRWQIANAEGQAWKHFPAIIKVANDHGSENLSCESVVYDEAGLHRRVQALKSEGVRSLMIAEFIEGREFTVAMWGNAVVEFLPLLEVDYSACPAGQAHVRTYAAKWDSEPAGIPGSGLIRAQTLCAETKQRIERLSRDAFGAFGLGDYARIDLRLKGTEPQVIDVNANPSLTLDSSFVQAAAHGGYTYSAVLDRIVRLAWERAEHRKGEGCHGKARLVAGDHPA